MKKISHLEADIIQYFKDNKRVKIKPKKLRGILNIPQHHYAELRDTIKNMAREGKLYRFRGNTYGLPDRSVVLVGTLRVPIKGDAHIIAEDGRKIILDKDYLRGACHDDTVSVTLFSKRYAGGPDARIKKIIKRGRNEFICLFHTVMEYALAIPEIKHLNREIIINNMSGLKPKEGAVIRVEITDWKDGNTKPYGKILNIIGSRENAEYDALLIANQFNIPDTWSQEIQDYTKKINFKIPDDKRIDLRDETIFTIDPEDARDFDDAVSLKKLDNGQIELGVHIADVAHYVQENDVLDKEALHRGTSVYFTRHVIPMLPEKLSNDLCSLKPNTDRLAMSVIMTLNSSGKLISSSIHNSVIHSKRRFSYEDVQAILNSGDGDYVDTLMDMRKLAKQLFKQRYKEGSIDFDLPEPQYVLDEIGTPSSISAKERLESHRIVEEFMLLANRTVATYVETKSKPNPFIYRIHEKPKEESAKLFFQLLKSLGYKFKFKGNDLHPIDFQKALEAVDNTAVQKYIEKIALRSMMKAKYDTENLGHFGLAFSSYTHFTSPIRRYPDLIVHRLLKKYISNEKILKNCDEKLKSIAKRSSDTEVRATEAEREYHKLKKIKFMEDKVGEEFDGMISGVTKFGLFIELKNNFVEGFVSRRDLVNDFWDYNKDAHILQGKRTRIVYRMGDPVKVKVLKVSIENGYVDFILIEDKKSEKAKHTKNNSVNKKTFKQNKKTN